MILHPMSLHFDFGILTLKQLCELDKKNILDCSFNIASSLKGDHRNMNILLI